MLKVLEVHFNNVSTFEVLEARLNASKRRPSIDVTEASIPCDKTVIIDTFFAFWSFLVAEQNFNFRFQRSCYKHGAHA